MSEKFKGRVTVALKLYKGQETYDKTGKALSEVNEMTLTYNDTMWKKNIDNLKYLGLSKVEVINYLEGEDSKDIPQSVIDEVQDAFTGGVKIELTADQKRMAELEADNAEMKKNLAELMKKEPAKKATEPAKDDKK